MQKNDASASWGWDLIVAGALLSRLPLPHAPHAAFDHQARAVWAYPVVGLVVAALSAILGGLAYVVTGHAGFAAGVYLAASMLCTGAMHEDGLADTADGFWGGFDPVRRLEIMKDSHIGSYGVLALVVSTGLRWSLLAALIPLGWAGVLAVGAVSRVALPVMMARMAHARETGLSHTVGRPRLRFALISVGLGTVWALFCIGAAVWPMLLTVAVVAGGIAWLARAKIGGQTGDVLGATQVMSEIAALAVLVALLP